MLGMLMIENSEWWGGTEEVMNKPRGGEAHPFMPRDQISAWPTVIIRSGFGEQMAIYIWQVLSLPTEHCLVKRGGANSILASAVSFIQLYVWEALAHGLT